MGLLIDGKWHDQWYDTEKTGGKFVRKESQFRNWISADGNTGFKAEVNRYHLYISLACPWASRTVIFRKLKGLEDIISLSKVDPLMLEQGWQLDDNHYIHELYTTTEKNYTGRVTVPVLWDKKQNTIVNNESAEIIRMLNSEFNALTNNNDDYYPQHLRKDIDAINEGVYKYINNGVYKCGFATEQAVYEEAFDELFAELEKLEKHLSKQRYLVKGQITEADWRLFITLIRFDVVYYSHFKCNLKQLRDYHHLHHYMLELYQYPGIADTVDFDDIKRHYYMSQKTINPTGIVPKGPLLDLEAKHDRETIPKK